MDEYIVYKYIEFLMIAVIIGLVFIPPTLALVSTLLGGLLLSKELSTRLPIRKSSY